MQLPSDNMIALMEQMKTKPVPIGDTHSMTAAALMSRDAATYSRRGTKVYLRLTKPGRCLYDYVRTFHPQVYKEALASVRDTKFR